MRGPYFLSFGSRTGTPDHRERGWSVSTVGTEQAFGFRRGEKVKTQTIKRRPLFLLLLPFSPFRVKLRNQFRVQREEGKKGRREGGKKKKIKEGKGVLIFLGPLYLFLRESCLVR